MPQNRLDKFAKGPIPQTLSEAIVEVALSRILTIEKFSKARERYIRGDLKRIPISLASRDKETLEELVENDSNGRTYAGFVDRDDPMQDGKSTTFRTTEGLRLLINDVYPEKQTISNIISHEAVHIAQALNGDEVVPNVYLMRPEEIEARILETPIENFVRDIATYADGPLSIRDSSLRGSAFLKVLKREREKTLDLLNNADSNEDAEGLTTELTTLTSQIDALQQRLAVLTQLPGDDEGDSDI